jgi:hypothetical protein
VQGMQPPCRKEASDAVYWGRRHETEIYAL